MKIKKGDNVIVITGKHKGETGKVIQVITATGRVLVEGVNKISRKTRPKKRGEKGQIVQREATINASNVMIVEDKKGVRTGKKLTGDKWVRVSKKSGKEI